MGMSTQVKVSADTMFLVLVIIVLAAVFAPFMTIWSLNTLFPQLDIPMNFYTWLAMEWINLMVIGRISKRA
jgi:hypothetical protein